jgi:hypothetical protein
MAEGARPARFRPSADTVAERLGDELILVHMKTDRMFVLNGTGARIWEFLSAGHDAAEIQRRLLQEYEVVEPEVEAGVHDLLNSLCKEQLITPVD